MSWRIGRFTAVPLLSLALFAVLERAIDATETAAHILEGIVIKNS